MHDHRADAATPDLERTLDRLWAGYADTTHVTRWSCTDDLLDLLNLATSRTVRVEVERALARLGTRRLLTTAEAQEILTGISAAVNVDASFGHLHLGPSVQPA